MKKRFVPFVLLLMMVCVSLSGVAYANTAEIPQTVEEALDTLEKEVCTQVGHKEEVLVSRIIEAYKYDTECFHKDYANNPDAAISMVRKVIDDMLACESQVQPYYFTGNYAWVDGVPTLTQAKYYYCGIASTLQVLVSKNVSISGSTYAAKQDWLDRNFFHLASGNGAMVYQVRNAINQFANAGYAYAPASSMSLTQFKATIRASLAANKPPILHAIPAYLSYYPSSSTTGHYITVTAINYDTNTITLNDCNYQLQYNGVFTVPIEEAYNAVHTVSGRYIIYGQ